MYKNIIPGLVSIETNLTKNKEKFLFNNVGFGIGFYEEIDKRQKFHYKVIMDSNFSVPKDYDFRSEYFLKKGNFWFYEKKILFFDIKFKYDIEKKIFYFSKSFRLIPFKIGGLFTLSACFSSFLSMELFLEGIIRFRGAAFQYHDKTYCIVAPGFNGKTTFLRKIIEKGGKYISEDNLIIDFSESKVYPTANAKMSKIFKRVDNKILENKLNKDNIIKTVQKIDKLFLVQNSLNSVYKTNCKCLFEFLILNSLHFLTDNLFIKSYLFEEGLTGKFIEKLKEIEKVNNYEFFQINDFKYKNLINNLK